MSAVTTWTAEEDEALVRFIGEGKSASQAAKELGRSRNACMSRAFRRNLQFKGNETQRAARLVRDRGKPPKRRRDLYSPEEDKIILEMAAERKSGSEIGAVLKRNGGSVIKRARHLGTNLNGRNGPKPSAEPKAPVVKLNSSNIAGKKASRAKDPEFSHVTPAVVVEPLMVALVDLKPGMCRFPVGDPRDETFGFCGHRKEPGYFAGPYCAAHSRLCYTAPEMRRRAA